MSAATQFEDNTSISKLMAGALLMDNECNELPFTWPDSVVTSSASVKNEREANNFPPNVDCWQMQNHTSAFSNNYPYIQQQNNGYGPVQHNGSLNTATTTTNGDHGQGQNGLVSGNSALKPVQDQYRHKYGTYGNEKYPDYNIAVKAETCDTSKWSPCAVNSTSNFEQSRHVQSSVLGEQFSPKSFKSLDNGVGGGSISGKQTPGGSSTDLSGTKRPFELVESDDSDSKASGTDGSQSGGNGNRADWPCYCAPVDINVNQMITSGVTVAGYKPRKVICKRKKACVPSEQKDNGYWEKRKKNNDSARRSREAKKEKERNFYKRALELEYENHCLKERIAFLERKLELSMQQNPNFSCTDA